MSQHHSRIKNDPRWKSARADVLDRDNYECQWDMGDGTICGQTEELEVHHIEELADIIDTAPELAFDLLNLITYCRPHHQEAGKAKENVIRNTWINPKYAFLSDILAPPIL